MKLGLIADVHADLDALKLALDILQGQGVNQVICAGDLVDKGLNGDAVVRLLRERQIPCVMGNHDEKAERTQYWTERTYGANSPLLLKEETLDFLMHLPLNWTFEWENMRVLLAHGRPWSNEEYLYPYSDKDTFREVLRHAQADVVILGHTHEPMAAQVNDQWIFNPGSVCGKHTYGSSTCATLTLPGCDFKVFELRSGQPTQTKFVSIV
jgi:putative phosphoesterase